MGWHLHWRRAINCISKGRGTYFYSVRNIGTQPRDSKGTLYYFIWSLYLKKSQFPIVPQDYLCYSVTGFLVVVCFIDFRQSLSSYFKWVFNLRFSTFWIWILLHLPRYPTIIDDLFLFEFSCFYLLSQFKHEKLICDGCHGYRGTVGLFFRQRRDTRF